MKLFYKVNNKGRFLGTSTRIQADQRGRQKVQMCCQLNVCNQAMPCQMPGSSQGDSLECNNGCFAASQGSGSCSVEAVGSVLAKKGLDTVVEPLHAEGPDTTELEEEYDNLLHEQETNSIPGKLYITHLYGVGNLPATARSSTVDWMVDIAFKLKLGSDSLFLGVQLLDQFLACVLQQLDSRAAVQHFLQSGKLQLTALTALWVAAKYEEAVVPGASVFLQQLPAYIGSNTLQGTITVEQLLDTEAVLLTVVDHRLTRPTPKTFLRRYLSRVDIKPQLYFTAGYLAELSLLDSGMLCYLPSTVAASAYVWALALTGHTCNNAHLSRLTGYTLAQVLPCLLRLGRVHQAACNTQTPCHISCKYLEVQLQQVAGLPPLGQGEVALLEKQLLCRQQEDADASSRLKHF